MLELLAGELDRGGSVTVLRATRRVAWQGDEYPRLYERGYIRSTASPYRKWLAVYCEGVSCVIGEELLWTFVREDGMPLFWRFDEEVSA